MIAVRLLSITLIAVLTQCATLGCSTAPADQRTVLRVAIFPYLPTPDGRYNDAMADRIEEEFEAENPGIDLQLRRPDLYENFYDPHFLSELLRGDDPVHVVEIDNVLMGTVLDLELVRPWPEEAAGHHVCPVAEQTMRVHNRLYGIPHWMCGYFVVSRDPDIAASRTAAELIAALGDADPALPNLVGNFAGSWETAAYYLDAWADTRPGVGASEGLRVPIDRDVMQTLADVFSEGEWGDTNPCLDTTYKDNNDAPELFGRGGADSLIGYSERIHYAVKTGADPQALHIGSAPMGDGRDPIWFVDSFVLRNDIDDDDKEAALRVREAAVAFVSYMNDPATFAWIHASEDLSEIDAPRYLIPAVETAFDHPALAEDPVMQQIVPLLDRGAAFPASGMPGIRTLMREDILEYLGQ